MTWGYAYTPHIWPSFLTVLLLATLAAYSGRRRSVPGALVFAIGCLVAALWAAGTAIEYAAVDAPTKIFWRKFQSAWMLPSATATTCFILEYAWPGRWLTRRNLALLFIPLLLVWGLILTNDVSHLLWSGFAVDRVVIPLRGPANWLFFAYGYGLGLVELVTLAWLFARSPQHRWPVVVMLAGLAVGRSLYLLGAARVLQSDLTFDMPPVAFEYLMYATALFAFRIFDPIALAGQRAIEQLQAGMVVLDPQGRIASLNPAAEQIFGASAGRAKGRPIRELLPTYRDGSWAGSEAEIEIGLPGGTADDARVEQERRHYSLAVSGLKDWRGLEAGRLLLLRDITGQKRAQAQIVEQQRALAMLQERERLARELHDSTGQVLGYVSLQAQAIAKRVRDGDTATAEAQLARLAGVAQDAHADLRDAILSLRAGEPASWSFLAALEQHLAAYEQNYGIRAEFIRPPAPPDCIFTPEVGVQLVRVIQEALTNARKHSQARNVRVIWTCEGEQSTIVVADDGCGFDLQALPVDGQAHFGLALMRERLAEIGGTLRVETAPGAGTKVVLQLPVGRRKDPERGSGLWG